MKHPVCTHGIYVEIEFVKVLHSLSVVLSLLSPWSNDEIRSSFFFLYRDCPIRNGASVKFISLISRRRVSPLKPRGWLARSKKLPPFPFFRPPFFPSPAGATRWKRECAFSHSPRRVSIHLPISIPFLPINSCFSRICRQIAIPIPIRSE